LLDRARGNQQPLATAWPCDQSARNAGEFFSARHQKWALGFLDHRSERKFLNISERGNDSGEPSNRAWVVAGGSIAMIEESPGDIPASVCSLCLARDLKIRLRRTC